MGFLQGILSSFSQPQSDPNFSEDLTGIEELLSEVSHQRAGELAAIAMLLGRVANADNEISDGEKKVMQDILISSFELTSKQASAVTQLAMSNNEKLSLDHHIVIRRINEFLAKPEKLKLMSMLFQLAAEDDISDIENSEIRQIGKALFVADSEFFEIRSDYHERLDILKK